jgi:hypothetical protein
MRPNLDLKIINKCIVDFKMRRGTKKSEEGREKCLINILHLIFNNFFEF